MDTMIKIFKIGGIGRIKRNLEEMIFMIVQWPQKFISIGRVLGNQKLNKQFGYMSMTK